MCHVVASKLIYKLAVSLIRFWKVYSFCTCSIRTSQAILPRLSMGVWSTFYSLSMSFGKLSSAHLLDKFNSDLEMHL